MTSLDPSVLKAAAKIAVTEAAGTEQTEGGGAASPRTDAPRAPAADAAGTREEYPVLYTAHHHRHPRPQNYSPASVVVRQQRRAFARRCLNEALHANPRMSPKDAKEVMAFYLKLVSADSSLEQRRQANEAAFLPTTARTSPS